MALESDVGGVFGAILDRAGCPLPAALIDSRSHIERDGVGFGAQEAWQLFRAGPSAASEVAEVGWHVNVVLARLDGTWRLVEAGGVYP